MIGGVGGCLLDELIFFHQLIQEAASMRRSGKQDQYRNCIITACTAGAAVVCRLLGDSFLGPIIEGDMFRRRETAYYALDYVCSGRVSRL